MIPSSPHQAIYRRWRAQTFGQIVGQEAVIETLRNAVRGGRVAHALLFVGPRGTGKTSTARIVAKALNCTDLRDGEPCDRCQACVAIREGRAFDVVEMDAATHNRVGDIRDDLLPRISTAPSDLRTKVFIVDEVQRITEGWDVLLKTLEEPPEHVVFIFCTTEPQKIRPAVLSRVQRFDFRRLTVPQIEGKLRAILAADERVADPDAIELVANLAAGGMRDAESMLDQLLSAGADRLTADQVRELLGLADAASIEAFVTALVLGRPLAGIGILDMLEERGRDLGTFLDQVVDILRAAITAALGPSEDRVPESLRGISLADLTGAARRLSAIDPSVAGPGGLHFQIELALLDRLVPVGGPAAVGGPAPLPNEPVPDSPAEATAPRPPRRTAPGARSTAGEAEPSGRGPRRSPRGAADERPAAESSAGRGRRPETGGPAVPDAASLPADPLEELRQAWPAIVAAVAKHPPLRPLIEACRPLAVDGSVVTVGFPEGQSFLREAAERKRAALEEGIGRGLGRAVALRCVVSNLALDTAPAGDEERLLAEARRIFADDLVDIGEVT